MIRIHRLNNKWIIVTGARSDASIYGFDRCWTGDRWSKRPGSAKKFPTRIEAQAEAHRMEKAAH